MSYNSDFSTCDRCDRETIPGRGCPEHEFKMGVCDNCGNPTYRSRVASFDVCSQTCQNELLQSGDVELQEDLNLPNPGDRSSKNPVVETKQSEEKVQKELFDETT